MSEDVIMKSLKKGEMLENISIYISVHDFDWRAICYFSKEKLYNKFIEYVEPRAQIKYIQDWNEFSD
jgi:hypothetical protein